MIGIPTPNVMPSLSYKLTCTGVPDPRLGSGVRLGVGVGACDVGLTGARLAAAGDWTLVDGACPPGWLLLHAVSATAMTQASAPHDRLRAIIMIKRYVLFLSTARAARRVAQRILCGGGGGGSDVTSGAGSGQTSSTGHGA
jgi:hypothetical protein